MKTIEVKKSTDYKPNIELLVKDLIDKSKKCKKGLIRLKNAAVTVQSFELASYLRDMETKLFPESAEQKAAKQKAKELVTLFGMVKLQVPDKEAYMVAETLAVYNKKKGKFDLKDAAKIITKANEYFDKID